MELAHHPTVKGYFASAATDRASPPSELDADWLRQLGRDSAADDVGLVGNRRHVQTSARRSPSYGEPSRRDSRTRPGCFPIRSSTPCGTATSSACCSTKSPPPSIMSFVVSCPQFRWALFQSSFIRKGACYALAVPPHHRPPDEPAPLPARGPGSRKPLGAVRDHRIPTASAHKRGSHRRGRHHGRSRRQRLVHGPG